MGDEIVSPQYLAKMHELGGLDALFAASGACVADALYYEAFVVFLESGRPSEPCQRTGCRKPGSSYYSGYCCAECFDWVSGVSTETFQANLKAAKPLRALVFL